MSFVSDTLKFQMISPEAKILDTPVKRLIVPAHDGQWGILPAHAPMICKLSVGFLYYWDEDSDDDDEKEMYFLHGGFAQIQPRQVTIFTQNALLVKEIGTTQAKVSLKWAQQLPAENDAQLQLRTSAIYAAKSLLAMAGK